jgi:predicted RNase H-like nuclease (RuvC/YqgF family)
MISDLRDRINQMQDDIQDSKDRNGEIDRLKDQCKKLKLEAEIKENQVRTLKVKLDHFEGENEQLKQSKRDDQAE